MISKLALAPVLGLLGLAILPTTAKADACSVTITNMSNESLYLTVTTPNLLPLSPGTGTVTCTFNRIDPSNGNLLVTGEIVANDGTPSGATTASQVNDTVTAFVTATDSTGAFAIIGLNVYGNFDEPASPSVPTSFSLSGTCDAGATSAGTVMYLDPYVNGSDVLLSNYTPSCSPSSSLSSTGSGTADTTLGAYTNDSEYLEFDFQNNPAGDESESVTLPAGVGSCGTGCVFPSSVPTPAPAPAPEPASLLLLGTGLLALLGAEKYRRIAA